MGWAAGRGGEGVDGEGWEASWKGVGGVNGDGTGVMNDGWR